MMCVVTITLIDKQISSVVFVYNDHVICVYNCLQLEN